MPPHIFNQCSILLVGNFHKQALATEDTDKFQASPSSQHKLFSSFLISPQFPEAVSFFQAASAPSFWQAQCLTVAQQKYNNSKYLKQLKLSLEQL